MLHHAHCSSDASDRPYASASASAAGLEHHVIEVSLDELLASDLPKAIRVRGSDLGTRLGTVAPHTLFTLMNYSILQSGAEDDTHDGPSTDLQSSHPSDHIRGGASRCFFYVRLWFYVKSNSSASVLVQVLKSFDPMTLRNEIAVTRALSVAANKGFCCAVTGECHMKPGPRAKLIDIGRRAWQNLALLCDLMWMAAEELVLSGTELIRSV